MISVEKLTKRYGPKQALDGVSFEVTPGAVTAFLGPNGSGKSTTMRLIMGLDEPDAGVARIGARRYRYLEWPLRQVGALLEARSFHPGRSARNHLRALARANAIPDQRVMEVLDLVGLANVADRRAGTFSVGMAQRLGIAAALLGDPGVLVLDEPSNGLDPDGIIWAHRLLRDLAAEGRTVLVSSHLISEMALTAQRLVIIGQGRLIATGTVADVVARSTRGFVRARTAASQTSQLALALSERNACIQPEGDGSLAVSGLDAADIASVAAASGIVLHELSTQTPSLEDAFVQLTRRAVEHRGDEQRIRRRSFERMGRQG